MNRILSWLGWFGLILLAILFVLGVTEAIKYVSPLERTLVLTAAVLAAAAVAFLRDWIKKGAPSELRKSERRDEPTQPERLDSYAQRSKDQRSKANLDARLPPEMFQTSPPTTALPIDDVILAARRQAILFRQIVPPKYGLRHLSFFGGLPIAPSGFQWPSGESKPLTSSCRWIVPRFRLQGASECFRTMASCTCFWICDGNRKICSV